jgi:flagellar biosynthesis protein FlhF
VRVAGSSTTPRDAVVAFVGSAGVGKTTIAVKLAVRVHVAEGIARIVSLDGVSLGVNGYLEAVASASGLPYTLAVTAEELEAALDRSQAGLTVIDAPGVNPRDPEAVAALARVLRVAQPSEVHLVVAATEKSEDALAAVKGLAPLGLTHVAFTRLDEATTCGSLLSVCESGGLPLSYVTAGREIPNDLNAATARGLARRVLRGELQP